jgi:hypothetical protein
VGPHSWVFFFVYLRELEVIWCKKTGSVPLVFAHKKLNNCQKWPIFISCG